MPLDVSSQAEDCERKVQNIWYDNGDVYLGTATKETFIFVLLTVHFRNIWFHVPT